MTLLAIDPGQDTGWAFFLGTELLYYGVTTVEGFRTAVIRTNRVVIERPQIYRPGLSKADPNDLITLAILVGRYVELVRGAEVELVTPAQWKGQLPKGVSNARVLKALSPKERTRVQDTAVPQGKRHNMLDAIGLGLWALKRGSPS